MGAIGGEELMKWEKMQAMNGREEKILVLVRLRPLSEKETASNEVADWECINDTTILYRNTLREGSTFPSTYTFGKDMFIYIFTSFTANLFQCLLGLNCRGSTFPCLVVKICWGLIEFVDGWEVHCSHTICLEIFSLLSLNSNAWLLRPRLLS
jgi:hypothetical protein